MSATLAVKVTPKSGKDQVTGVQIVDGAQEVCVRVTAPPDKGKANAAVCKLLAKSLCLPKSAVEVKRGDTSHHKLLEIACDQETVNDWVAGLPQLD